MSYSSGVLLWLLLLLGAGPSTELPGKYTLVYPRLLQDREISGEKVLKISDDLTLQLKQSNLLPSQFIFSEYDGEALSHHEYLNGDEYQRGIYYDDEQMAALRIDDSDGIRVEGILGDGLRIEPLSANERSAEGHLAHKLYEVEVPHGDITDGDGEEENGKSTEDVPEKTSTASEEETDPDYPQSDAAESIHVAELLLLVDSQYKDKFGYMKTRHNQLINYLLVMVTSAATRIAPTGVALRIIAIIVEKTSFPVTKPPNEEDQIYGRESLSKFITAVQRRNRDLVRQADLVYLVTGYNMIRITASGEVADQLGLASGVGGVCSDDSKFAMGEDQPKLYTGAPTMAHELLHTLGSVHDSQPAPPSIPGHPGAENCSNFDHIMASLGDFVRESGAHAKVSRCTIEQVQYVLSLPDKKCLQEVRSSSEVTTSGRLPGEFINYTQYCKEKLGDEYHHPDIHVPKCYFKCLLENPETTTSNIGLPGSNWHALAAPDGVRCDKDKKLMVGHLSHLTESDSRIICRAITNECTFIFRLLEWKAGQKSTSAF